MERCAICGMVGMCEGGEECAAEQRLQERDVDTVVLVALEMKRGAHTWRFDLHIEHDWSHTDLHWYKEEAIRIARAGDAAPDVPLARGLIV